MIRCSFCGHDNEDGLLFCDQCKTDLTARAAVVSSNDEMAADHLPFALAASGKSETDVPTLHFDKIPLVETLGVHAADSGELTRPSPVSKQPFPPLVPAPPTVPEGIGGLATAPASGSMPPADDARGVKPQLVVIRGEKVDTQYAIYPGKNYLGRTDDKPVDIDLENQEPADRIWTSRQHAVISFENGLLTIEDLNSLNGTFVNRMRVHPGQVRALQANDIVQVGTVQLRVILA